MGARSFERIDSERVPRRNDVAAQHLHERLLQGVVIIGRVRDRGRIQLAALSVPSNQNFRFFHVCLLLK